MDIRYISLFSGIEAATVAWEPLGWIPVAFAQYEPGDNIQFPSKVLQYHYPDVPNLGDVTKITEEQIKALGHIDLVVGGSPCQDLSIAGQRRGLVNEDGSLTRSGLFDYQMQIFEWARRNNGCEWMLWENVPGAFSSNNGRDFGYILGSMVQRDVPVPKDGWKNSGVCVSENGDRIVEWRVLDAQYFGVPQRRRRIFALLHTGAWWEYPPVLFESESLPWDSQASLHEGEGSAGGAEEGSGETGGNILRLFSSHPSDSRVKGPVDKADTITGSYDTGGGNTPLVTEEPPSTGRPGHDGKCTSVVFGISSKESNAMNSPNPNAGVYIADTSRTLDANGGNPSCNQGGMAVVYGIGRTAVNGGYESGMSFPLENDLEPTLTASDFKDPPSVSVEGECRVRRFMPVECERLQGFPDGYTDIPWPNAEHAPDSHRYKALGNSMAVPVMRWIGKRIEWSLSHPITEDRSDKISWQPELF